MITSCFAFVSYAANAQISVEEYCQSVIDYSLDLKITASQSAYNEHALSLSKRALLPSLSMSGNYVVGIKELNGAKRWDFNLQPQITQSIFGGEFRSKIKIAELQYSVALLDESSMLLDVRYNASYAYWNLIARRKYREAVDSYVEIIRSLKQIVEKRFNEGYIAKGDWLMICTRLSEAEYEQVVAEQNYSIAKHNFNILRGESVEADVIQSDPTIQGVTSIARASIDDMLGSRPDYIAQLEKEDIAQIEIKSSVAQYNPQLSVGVGGVWSTYRPNLTSKTYVDGNVFASLSIPIFHFSERRQVGDMARAQYKISRLKSAKLYDELIIEESNGWRAIVDSRAQMIAAKASLEVAVENLEISTYSYNEGLTTILDVLQAQIGWIQLSSNAIYSEFNHLIAIANYEKITAKKLEDRF